MVRGIMGTEVILMEVTHTPAIPTLITKVTTNTTIMPETLNKHFDLLHLLHLASPALPVGAYAYSQGLETAVENRWVHNVESTYDWISQVMINGLARLDVPVLIRLHNAWQSQSRTEVYYWNNFLLASRESKELLLEDTQMGDALRRLLAELDVQPAKDWPTNESNSFVTLFALACHHWKLDQQKMITGYMWSWLENQIAAALKLVPLGQTEAQKCLIKLMPVIETATKIAVEVSDDEIGNGLPGLILGSMQHEQQYSRLFRS